VAIPATIAILHNYDVWVCDTTNEVFQDMTSGHIEISPLMDVTMTHDTKEGVEGDTFKITNVRCNGSYNCNLFRVSRCRVNDWTVTGAMDQYQEHHL
jgi:hypothetical protein